MVAELLGRSTSESGFAGVKLMVVRRSIFRRIASSCAGLGIFVVLMPLSATATSPLDPCPVEPDLTVIHSAFRNMEDRSDPCGESQEVLAILKAFRECSKATYRICTDPSASRNYFDRPNGDDAEGLVRAITWNPELRTELEPECADDEDTPVRRDPIASLLHEIVHAVQDCQGLNPGEHELDAVRVENIYRRSAGLCQRRGYGEARLPSNSVKVCGAHACPCTPPADTSEPDRQLTRSTTQTRPTTLSGDAESRHADSGD